jgi:diguanylate cyclase (GGDEF)-like protein/PAS domain S-box-containing protein
VAFRRNQALLASDRWARDMIATHHYNQEDVERAFGKATVMPSAIPGMIFMLHHFSSLPHMREAVQAWHSVDGQVDELGQIADELEKAYAAGGPSRQQLLQERHRIAALNDFIEPRSRLFSLEIAHGATWLGGILFGGVFAAACIATLLWLGMARRVLASIRGTEERYRLLFDSAADAIVMLDERSGRVLDANRTALEWTGRDERDLVGMRFDELFERHRLHDDGVVIGALRGIDGRTRPTEAQSSLVDWGNRQVRQAIIRDISERVSMEQERRIAAEALASVAEGVIIADAQRRVVQINSAHAVITGFSSADLQGRLFDTTRQLPDGSPLPESIWELIAAGGNWLGEVLSQRKDGSSYPEMLSICAIRDAHDRVQHYVAVCTNITTAKAHQRRLEHMATHDPLTGLANRAEFERCCARAIAAAAEERGAAAVLFVDLDAFKAVNDSYSHAVGDRLLARIAERINEQLDEGDVAGRIGGDEFTVLIGRLVSREQASALARRLLAALAEPIVVGDYEIVLSASIGIAGYPLDGADPAALIASADAAMYAAKTQERNTYRFYSPIMQADARKRLALAAELRQALVRGEFRLVYQPSMEMRSGRIVAVEALLRWRHPERGEVLPSDFIPMAEGLGLIRHIDEWVLGAAVQQMQAWHAAGVPPIRMAVNISASSYALPSFVHDVRQRLATADMPPERLLLEITESAMLRLGDEMERTMQALHALGVGVAIDDFGTGYSSLAYLKLPAIAYLKIDQSFVAGLPGSNNDAAIVEAMLALSRSLGLCPIAEGIETEAQHDFLLRAGCVEGQGYLYSRPVEPEEIERLLKPSERRGAVNLRLVPPRRG